MKKKILIIVDNPFRDLPGCVLLAAALVSKKHQVYLTPHNLVFRNNFSELIEEHPDFVLLNYLRKNNEHLAEVLIKCNIPFGVLDTEGGVLADEASFLESIAGKEEVLKNMIYFFSWGYRLADYLVEKKIFKKEQVKVTGSPRYDFYSSLWNINSVNEVNNLRPYLLINTNYTLINPVFLTPEQEVKMYVESFQYPINQVLEWQNIDKTGMQEMIEIAKALSVKFTNINIVLRPHPFEKSETYSEALKGFRNVHVIKKGTVVNWIRHAKVVIQRNCSTSIEAGFLGIPSLSPHYIPVFRSLPTSEAVSIKCNSIDEIEEKIRLIMSKKLQIPEEIENTLKVIEEEWFYKIDGKAHQRIADAIDGYLRNNNNSVNEKEIKKVLTTYPRLSKKHVLKQSIKNIIDGKFKIYTGKQKLEDDFKNYLKEWDKSEKMFNKESVNSILAQIKENVKKNEMFPEVHEIIILSNSETKYQLCSKNISRTVLINKYV